MSENKTTAANPPALGYILWNSVRLLSPAALPHSLSLSPLYNPLKHPSFLAVISFPMLSASARFDFIPLLSNCLFVRHPYLLSTLPSAASHSSLAHSLVNYSSVCVCH